MQGWQLTPNGSEGWRKAEVMRGGVDTRELSSQTLESKRQPGLYFIGEVVDVTGWLGGYNFQWAWASAAACARSMVANSSAADRALNFQATIAVFASKPCASIRKQTPELMLKALLQTPHSFE